jgi:regulator of ribonuclease activity A
MEPEHHHAHGPANRGRVVLTTAAPLFVCEPPAPAGAAVIALHGPHGITADFEWGLRAVAAQGYLVAAPIHYFRDGGHEYVSAVTARHAYAALSNQDIDADVDGAVDHVTGRLRLRLAALIASELAAPAVRRAASRHLQTTAVTVPDHDGGRAGDGTPAGWLAAAAHLGCSESWPASAGRAVLPMSAVASPRLSTADLSDEHPDVAQACGGFTQYGGRRWFAGPVVTVRCHEDTRLARTVLSEPGDGRVLVVDGGGSLSRALLGDVSAGMAAANGWAGVVIHGAVRDSQALRYIDLGVAALGTCPVRGGTAGAGERDVTITVRGAHIVPGGHLAADEDGLLFLPQAPATNAKGVAAAGADHPYRAAVVAGGLAHVSGALGVDAEGRAVPGRRPALTAAMDRLAERLGTVGAGFGDLVKCTFYVTDVSLRAEANDLYRELFPAGPPARTFVEVTALPYGATVEIDAIARANARPA